MPAEKGNEALAEWAEAAGLDYAVSVQLPEQTDVLGRRGKVEGAATGRLPGGIEGTLLFYTYTWTDSDGDSHDVPFTLVVTRVPESIGFAPYLTFSGRESSLTARLSTLAEMRKLDLGDTGRLRGTSAYVYEGTDENWITQLLSPALVDWLARSDEAFGFELVEGVLVVALDRHRGGRFLQALCEDAARLATAIREQSVAEAETGGAKAKAARDSKVARRMSSDLEKVSIPSPPDSGSARSAFASYLRRSPRLWLASLAAALAATLLLNVPGVALPIILTANGAYALLAAIELTVLATIFFLAFRSNVRKLSATYAEEAFYRAYAADRGLKLEEPLLFAATHTKAKLPFMPDRVFSGELPGGFPGSLALCGDGRRREDRIALLAGPGGPIAEAELRADPAPVAAKTLDSYAKRLGAELKSAT